MSSPKNLSTVHKSISQKLEKIGEGTNQPNKSVVENFEGLLEGNNTGLQEAQNMFDVNATSVQEEPGLKSETSTSGNELVNSHLAL